MRQKVKIAHLILVHHLPHQVLRLVNSIQHPGADIFIHVDAKSDLKPFEEIFKIKNVYCIDNRTKVYWGTYSIIEATLRSFETVLKQNTDYSYINLLSGSDYPLKPIEEFHSFLETHPGKAFFYYKDILKDWPNGIDRTKKYFLADYMRKGSFKIAAFINLFLPARKVPHNFKLLGHSQWFTITPQHARYLIDYIASHPEVKRYFRLSFAPDEFMFPTILYSSPLKNTIVNDNLRYIDWSENKNNPKTLTTHDAAQLLKSGKFFARKFDTQQNTTILDYLDKYILRKRD